MGGNEIAIGGFILTGDANSTRRVLIRGIGPSLPSFVSNRLPDPNLSLHAFVNNQDTVVASNDNWKVRDSDSVSQQAQIEATGIPPTDNSESALIATVSPGIAYSALLSGTGSSTGIGLMEIFDLDSGVQTKLANMSTRALVGMGDDVLIGGIIIGGGSNVAVVMDALGPSLPLSGTLTDPFLTLHDSNGAVVASNNDWQDDANHNMIPSSISSRYNTKDSALYRVLAPEVTPLS